MKRRNPLPAAMDEAETDEEEYQEANHSLEAHHRVRAGAGLDEDGMDPDDPNVSAFYAQAGAEDRLREIGF